MIVAIIFSLGCFAGAALGELTAEDVVTLKNRPKDVNVWLNPYPFLDELVEREGLIPLTRQLLRHQEPELVKMGLSLMEFHRLSMLRGELIPLMKHPEHDYQAMQAWVSAGVPIETALREIQDKALRDMLIGHYVDVGILDRQRVQPVYLLLREIVHDNTQAKDLRRAAWRSLAGKKWPFTNVLVLSLNEWLKFSEDFSASDKEIVSGLRQYGGLVAADQFRPYLSSKDPAAAVEAASILAGYHEPEAVPVLMQLLTDLKTEVGPMQGVVGLKAYNVLMQVDNAKLLRLALRQLIAGKNAAVPEAIRRLSDEGDKLEEMGAILFHVSTRRREAEALVAAIINWWNDMNKADALKIVKTDEGLKVQVVE